VDRVGCGWPRPQAGFRRAAAHENLGSRLRGNDDSEGGSRCKRPATPYQSTTSSPANSSRTRTPATAPHTGIPAPRRTRPHAGIPADPASRPLPQSRAVPVAAPC